MLQGLSLFPSLSSLAVTSAGANLYQGSRGHDSPLHTWAPAPASTHHDTLAPLRVPDVCIDRVKFLRWLRCIQSILLLEAVCLSPLPRRPSNRLRGIHLQPRAPSSARAPGTLLALKCPPRQASANHGSLTANYVAGEANLFTGHLTYNFKVQVQGAISLGHRYQAERSAATSRSKSTSPRAEGHHIEQRLWS